jgi:hypothetical protein
MASELFLGGHAHPRGHRVWRVRDVLPGPFAPSRSPILALTLTIARSGSRAGSSDRQVEPPPRGTEADKEFILLIQQITMTKTTDLLDVLRDKATGLQHLVEKAGEVMPKEYDLKPVRELLADINLEIKNAVTTVTRTHNLCERYEYVASEALSRMYFADQK